MKIEEIDISNPDKLIFPKQNLTKLDMITYYDKIADRMLPFLKDRPLTLQRFPDGIDKDGFYQKNAADYFPDFIEKVSNYTSNTKIVIDNLLNGNYILKITKERKVITKKVLKI